MFLFTFIVPILSTLSKEFNLLCFPADCAGGAPGAACKALGMAQEWREANAQMKKNKKNIVVGIGEILWDLLPSGKQLGGAPANFAYFAHALGAESYVASSVGRDSSGREILAKLDELGLDRRHVAADKEHLTGVVEVRLDGDGKPSYEIKEDVAWDFIRSSSDLLSLARKADAVCFGTLAQRSVVTRETIRAFVDSVAGTGLKVFDINLRQSFYDGRMIHDLLKRTNILKLNDEELAIVTNLLSVSGSETEVAAKLLRQYELRLVAVTKGAAGATLYGSEGSCSSKGKAVRVVDTVGAGDAFTAGLVMGLLNDFTLPAIGELANSLAVYVCGQHGATPPLPPEILNTLGGRNFRLRARDKK